MPLVHASNELPSASIVVPSYNSMSTIGDCLQALQTQDCGESYEILVIDSSDDGTGSWLQRQFPAIRLERRRRRTLPGEARNLGARSARGAVVAFIDADCVAPRDWLGRHLGLHQEYDVIGGSVDNQNPDNWVGWASYLLEFSGFTPHRSQRLSRCLISANLSVKRSLMEDYRFPEDLWPGEDRVFLWQISKHVPTLLDASLSVGHINRSRLSAFRAHQARSGAAAFDAWQRIEIHSVLRKHPSLAFLTPWYRLAVTTKRIAQDTPAFLLPMALLWPVMLLGGMNWARAFHRAATGREPE